MYCLLSILFILAVIVAAVTVGKDANDGDIFL